MSCAKLGIGNGRGCKLPGNNGECSAPGGSGEKLAIGPKPIGLGDICGVLDKSELFCSSAVIGESLSDLLMMLSFTSLRIISSSSSSSSFSESEGDCVGGDALPDLSPSSLSRLPA